MGTTTVKGAGRRKFEANKRHQQRTPLPPKGSTAVAEARAIVKEEAEKIVADKKASKEPKPERVSKAQQLAIAAEEAGWEVERSVEGTHKTLIARRGEEELEAHWENDKSCVPLGWHTVGGHKAKFQHVTVALKIIGTDPDVAAANAATVSQSRKAPRAVTHRSLAQGVPFNVATATDEEVLAALVGREITWRNTLSGDITETAVVPEAGTKTRLDQDDLDDLATRQLTFCDAAGGGYSTLRLSQLTSVGAKKDAHGHLLIETRHKAQEAMREGRK
jgi:hypothetical protein